MNKISKNELKNFTIIPNSIVNNPPSAQALALYVYMASKPEGWQFYNSHLQKHFKWSRHTLKKYIDQLVDNGYLERSEQQTNNKNQFLPISYNIVSPMSKNCTTAPMYNFSATEKNRIGKSIQHSNTILKSNTNLKNNTERNAHEEKPNQEPSKKPKKEKLPFEDKIGRKQAELIQDIELEQDKITLLVGFLEYRKEKRKPYTTQKGLKTLVKDFQTHTADQIEWVANQTYAHEWQGLFFDKLNNRSNGQINDKKGWIGAASIETHKKVFDELMAEEAEYRAGMAAAEC